MVKGLGTENMKQAYGTRRGWYDMFAKQTILSFKITSRFTCATTEN
jgi:hypothetical protein